MGFKSAAFLMCEKYDWKSFIEGDSKACQRPFVKSNIGCSCF